MLNDYPPDIQAKHGPMSERSKRQRIPAALVVLAIMAGVITASFQTVRANSAGDIQFLDPLVHLAVMFTVFNLLDRLIVVTLRPGFIILPGTEGLAGYTDYRFHFRGFVIGLGITAIASVVAAAIIATVF